MTDIQQAREWAESRASGSYILSEETRAAVKVIQSLPDQWIDAEKVRKIYDLYRNGDLTLHEAFSAAVALIPTPAPRTLADMSLEELKPYIRGEVMVDGWANPTMLVSIIDDEGAVLARRLNKPWPFVEVRPLSDLTPVAAPEQEAEDAPEPVQPRPEDVPDPQPGEAWLIEYRGKRYEALFWYSELYAHWTFGMGRKGTFTVESPEATPIARLVPEVKP